MNVAKKKGEENLSLLSWFNILYYVFAMFFSHVLVTTHSTKLHREPNMLCYITQGAQMLSWQIHDSERRWRFFGDTLRRDSEASESGAIMET